MRIIRNFKNNITIRLALLSLAALVLLLVLGPGRHAALLPGGPSRSAD